jgi:hypothetical protein
VSDGPGSERNRRGAAENHDAREPESRDRSHSGREEQSSNPCCQAGPDGRGAQDGQSRAGVSDGPRDVQQILRIFFARVTVGDHGGVAGLLGEARDLALEPPGERMEPEDRSIDQCDALNEGIAAADVLPLVDQNGAKLSGRPAARRSRQNHGRAEAAHRDRRCTRRMRQDAVPRDGLPHQDAYAPDPDCQSREEDRKTGQVDHNHGELPIHFCPGRDFRRNIGDRRRCRGGHSGVVRRPGDLPGLPVRSGQHPRRGSRAPYDEHREDQHRHGHARPQRVAQGGLADAHRAENHTDRRSNQSGADRALDQH